MVKAVARNKDDALWRVPPELLSGAQDDATKLAVRDMEDAGIDIVTDGEIRRESYGTRFALSLDLLKGSQIDFIDELAGAQFQVRNPNAKSSCGCGVSFSV